MISFLVAAANASRGVRLFRRWQTDHALERRRSPETFKHLSLFLQVVN
jgi:hypothetical protein